MTAVDFLGRLQRAKSAVADAGLTALLISAGPDLRYLTGYEARSLDRLTCLIVPAVGDPLIVVPRLGKLAAASLLAAAQVQLLTWGESDDPYALVASQLPRHGAVAVSDRMWAAQAFSLHEAMPGLSQRASGAILKPLRMRKDENEVRALRAAGAAIDSVHARVPDWLRAGRTESAVGADVRVAMLKAGHVSADLVIVASGPNGASPHHEVSDRVIVSGDALVVDIGGTMPSGYWSDCTRTYVVGEPSEDFVALYSVLGVAQEAACEAVKAGAAAQTIDAAARDIITEAGYGAYFTHRTGHGIGLEAHEEPYISVDNGEPLVAGMAFSIEPGIYIPDRYGARIEDIVVCTDSGWERFNFRPHDLVVIAG